MRHWEFEPKSSARAASTLNCCSITPAPDFCIFETRVHYLAQDVLELNIKPLIHFELVAIFNFPGGGITYALFCLLLFRVLFCFIPLRQDLTV